MFAYFLNIHNMKCYLDIEKSVITYREEPRGNEYEMQETVEYIEWLSYEKVIEVIKEYVKNIVGE